MLFSCEIDSHFLFCHVHNYFIFISAPAKQLLSTSDIFSSVFILVIGLAITLSQIMTQHEENALYVVVDYSS